MNKKELICYNYDASGLVGKADKVVFPKTALEVQKIITGANKDIVPRGSGTNLVGGCVPNNSIVVGMGKMNKVSEFNSMKKTVRVEAGVTLKELNEKLARVNFEFPIETFNKGISTIGGMVALNSPGFRSMKYGIIRDWINEIEFVNGRGELMKLGKSDLTDVCGMEGITGIITSVILRVMPKKKRSASIFQAEDLEEIFSIARRLKLEKEVVMLEFFPPEVSKLLGLPEKYHLIIEFDSERGKIKGNEYKIISRFKSRIYDILYSEGYYHSEDPKFFFDKLKEFIIYLEANQIPYFGYLDIGIVHPFFKDDEKEKREEVINLIKKSRGKPAKYGIGLKRKYLVDSFEKKVLQRVKLRHDPFGKLNRGKIIDVDSFRTPADEGVHLKPIRKEEIEEIIPLIGEDKSASEINAELKSPNEKMEDFIEKVELMDEIAENEKPIKVDRELEVIREKEKSLEINKEIKERLEDYEQTFESELIGERKKNVEDFALNIGRQRPMLSVDDVKKQREETKPEEHKSIQDLMTNKYKQGRVVVQDNLDRGMEKTENKIEMVEGREEIIEIKEENLEDKKESDMIKDIMNNRFGFSEKKKGDENER